MNIRLTVAALFVTAVLHSSICAQAGEGDNRVLELMPGDKWWGGCVVDGDAMPYGKEPILRDLYGDTRGNQAQPLLISNHGRYVWCEDPLRFSFSNGKLVVETMKGKLITGKVGDTLREAYRYVSTTFFPSTGTIPEPMLFTRPQYNTWIELMYDQREERIRKYATDIIANGFPPGVLMIDDNWQEDYGVWDFHPGRFHDPKGMMESLHQMGFKVMLWLCPFVSADSATSRGLAKQGLLLRTPDGEVFIRRWWNGYSAILDLTNDEATEWFREVLDRLVSEYGVDGFKLDGGDAHSYRGDYTSHRPANPNAHSELWARLGVPYPLNEYRACWKCGGQPLAQRLRDKDHEWDDLRKLIPHALAQGLMGYAYTCPDMIGGGEYKSFLDMETIDQELIVRSAQCSALMPMMQFSVAPWRVLNDENLAICLKMAKLHADLGEEILALAKESSRTSEPIVRHMEYTYPHQGYAEIADQFLLGENILVAPVLEPRATTRAIVFPEGTWIGDDGSEVQGPCTLEVSAPVSRLPWYRRK